MRSVLLQWCLALICVLYTLHVRWVELKNEPITLSHFFVLYIQNPGALQTLLVFYILTCAIIVEATIRFLFNKRAWDELRIPYAYLLFRGYLIFRLDINGQTKAADTMFLLVETVTVTGISVVIRSAHTYITSTYRSITDALTVRAESIPNLPEVLDNSNNANSGNRQDQEQAPNLATLVQRYMPDDGFDEPTDRIYNSPKFLLFPLILGASMFAAGLFGIRADSRLAMLSLDFVAIFTSAFTCMHDLYFMKQTILRCMRPALVYAAAATQAATQAASGVPDSRVHYEYLRNGFRVHLAAWNVHSSKAQANSTRILLYNDVLECILALLQMYLYLYSFGIRQGSALDTLLPLPVAAVIVRALLSRKHANQLSMIASVITRFADAGPDHPRIRSGDVCPICLETMETAKILPCGHLLHEHCLFELHRFRGGKCPLCRQPFEQAGRSSRRTPPARPPEPTPSPIAEAVERSPERLEPNAGGSPLAVAASEPVSQSS